MSVWGRTGRPHPFERRIDSCLVRPALPILKAIGNPRRVVKDHEARYFGGRVEERL